METWLKLSIWVAVYGFLKDCQPLDSYIAQYLEKSLNITEKEVYQEIFPIATYTSLVELIFVFLLTDWLRYRPVIFVNAVSYIGMMVTLIWYPSSQGMKVMEICFGTMMSTEVAYFTYIYTKVGKEHYQSVTSYMRTSSLLGRCFGCLFGQLLIMKNLATMAQLCYIQLFGAIITFIWAFLLPPVKTSLYFYRYDNTILDKAEGKPVVVSNSDIHHQAENGYSPAVKKISRVPCIMVVKRLWNEFKYVYTSSYTLKWSIWYALFQAGYNQEGTYTQTLWNNIAKGSEESILQFTGVTESCYTIFGALTAFASGYLIVKNDIICALLMSISPILQGLLVIWAAHTTNLWHAFTSHVLFSGVYYFAVSIAYAEIAKNIPCDCFALVFGINTFISLVIQTFLTAMFNAKGGFELDSRQQFVVLGSYLCLLGSVFLLKCIYSCLRCIIKTPIKGTTTVSK